MSESRLAHATRWAKERRTTRATTRTPWKGFIYVIQDGEYTKIGIALSVAHRMYQLQVGNPRQLTLLKSWEVEDVSTIEDRLHSMLSRYYVRGEWFKLSPTLLTALVKCTNLDEFLPV